jgi:hypothetical protein
VFVFVGVTVGFFTTDVGVVFVVGVVVVLFVIVGLTAGVVTFGVVVVVFVAGVVVLDVSVGLVVKGTLGARVVLGFAVVFVVKDAGGFVGRVGFGAVGAVGKVGLVVGLVTVEVIGGRVTPPPVGADGLTPLPVGNVPMFELGRSPEPSEVIEPDSRPVSEGRSLNLRMTLSSGARSSPLASGSCLLDVRFFRIAMSYPVFFTNEVRPAILLTGLNFAVLANVFAGCTGTAF